MCRIGLPKRGLSHGEGLSSKVFLISSISSFSNAALAPPLLVPPET